MSMIEQVGHALDFIRGRKRSYQISLMSPEGQRVLQDLARFCRANETCFNPDPRIHAVAEGRREVWLRIQQHLNLSSEDLYTLYSGRTLRVSKPTETEDE